MSEHMFTPEKKNPNSKRSSKRAGVRGRGGGGGGERFQRKREEEEDEEGEKKKKEKADVLEPEKCPLPREVGPFFPLLTGGENIYKTNRAARYLGEQ